MKVIMIGNVRGGQGKSFISHNMAAILYAKGYRTLLIDGDGFAPYVPFDNSGNKPTLEDVMLGTATINDAIYRGEHFDYVEGVRHWNDISLQIKRSDEILNGQLALLSNRYDYVVIDGPVGSTARNQLLVSTADELVIPLRELSNLEGISDYIEDILSTRLKDNFRVRGYLCNFVAENESLYIDMYYKQLEKLIEIHDFPIFKNTIRESSMVDLAEIEKKYLIELNEYVGVRQDMEHFVEEYLAS